MKHRGIHPEQTSNTTENMCDGELGKTEEQISTNTVKRDETGYMKGVTVVVLPATSGHSGKIV